MLQTHSKQQAIRNNLIRISTIIMLTLLLNKIAGLPIFLSIIIAYITGFVLMLLMTYVLDKNNHKKTISPNHER